jgi:hypothetical protein
LCLRRWEREGESKQMTSENQGVISDYPEKSIQFINSKNLQIKKLSKLKFIILKNTPKMIIYLIYLIEEHTFTPPRKLEFCYPLVLLQK